MTKREFLQRLEVRLNEEKIGNASDVVDFYDEMISDRMEDGMDEKEAIDKNKDIESIVNSMNLEKSMPSLIKDTIAKKHDKAKKNNNVGAWTALLIIGAPIWLPVAIAYLAVVFALLLSLFLVMVAYFVVAVCLPAGSIACLLKAFTVFGGSLTFAGSIYMVGAALVLAGVSILMWMGSKKMVVSMKDAIKKALKKAKGGILCINR